MKTEQRVSVEEMRQTFDVLDRLCDDDQTLVGSLTYYREAQRSLAMMIVQRAR